MTKKDYCVSVKTTNDAADILKGVAYVLNTTVSALAGLAIEELLKKPKYARIVKNLRSMRMDAEADDEVRRDQ
jgi:hypothetical protein